MGSLGQHRSAWSTTDVLAARRIDAALFFMGTLRLACPAAH